MTDSVVLAIDDEKHARELLRVVLELAGYEVLDAESGCAGLEIARSRQPSLVLLDLGLPDLDGREVLRRLRKQGTLPIIVVSGRNSEDEKVAVLDQGADDYVIKPFMPKELLARIRVALRRAAGAHPGQCQPSGQFGTGRLHVDFDKRQVLVNGREVRLTPTEYRLLWALVDSAGHVASHRQLLEEVWGSCESEHIHYLRVYMRRLRQKLEPDPESPRYLVTEPTLGYRLRMAR
ncbi:MAG TPA: response regulator [Polyangiaceae bacterium]|nr:response regulator [Polyangiaceae bacterium]